MKTIIKLTFAAFIVFTFFACSKNDKSYSSNYNPYDYATNMNNGTCEKCGTYTYVEPVTIGNDRKYYCKQHLGAARDAAAKLNAWQN